MPMRRSKSAKTAILFSRMDSIRSTDGSDHDPIRVHRLFCSRDGARKLAGFGYCAIDSVMRRGAFCVGWKHGSVRRRDVETPDRKLPARRHIDDGFPAISVGDAAPFD